MTLKDIFNSAINFDLTNIVYFVGGIILILSPILFVWFGGLILKDVLINEQPHDRDLFEKFLWLLQALFVLLFYLFF